MTWHHSKGTIQVKEIKAKPGNTSFILTPVIIELLIGDKALNSLQSSNYWSYHDE